MTAVWCTNVKDLNPLTCTDLAVRLCSGNVKTDLNKAYYVAHIAHTDLYDGCVVNQCERPKPFNTHRPCSKAV